MSTLIISTNNPNLFLDHQPDQPSPPTLLYDISLDLDIRCFASEPNRSQFIDATLATIALQFALRHEEWKSVAHVVHALLTQGLNTQSKRHWAYYEPMDAACKRKLTTSGHLQCISVPSDASAVYDEFKYEDKLFVNNRKVEIEFSVKIFISPAISSAGVVYENRGFKTFMYVERLCYRGLHNQLNEIVSTRGAEGTPSVSRSDWKLLFNYFKNSKLRMMVPLIAGTPFDPFAPEPNSGDEAETYDEGAYYDNGHNGECCCHSDGSDDDYVHPDFL